MADIIATEAQAASIGGGSSYTANLMVTRVRAVALGCGISGSYSDNLLVCLKDLYKACSCLFNCNCNTVCTCNSTCTCTGGHWSSSYCSCNTTCSCTGGHWSSSYCSCDTTCSCTATCNCNLETTYTGACTCTSVLEKGTCTCYIACSPYCLKDHVPGYNCSWNSPDPPGSCTPGYCYCNSADSCSYYGGSCSGYEACVQICRANLYCYIDQQCTCNTVSRYCTSQCNCTSYCNCQSECSGDGTGSTYACKVVGCVGDGTGSTYSCNVVGCVGDGTGSTWGCTCQYVG